MGETATPYDPSDHTIEEVNDYLKDNPNALQHVLDAEKARGDDARVTLVDSLQSQLDERPDVPEPVEASPVEVAPAAAPVSQAAASAANAKTDKVFGQDYNVTPESGYRKS